MGLAKRAQEEAEERLFWPTYEIVCLEHISDRWLRANAKRSESGSCGVCGAHAAVAVELDSLLDLIAATIRANWGRAIDELFLDRESPSGYALVPDPSTTDELIRSEMDSDLDDMLIEAVAPRFVEDEWFDRGRIWLVGTELLTFGWESFSRWAKSTTGPLDHDLRSLDPWDLNEEADGISPDRMMGRVLGMVDEIGLVITDDRHWYRTVHLPPGEPVTARRVGTVPTRYAIRPNRMSPAGVAMFYGAADPATAAAEVGPPTAELAVFTGEWAATRPLSVLDLTNLRSAPSFYDVERRSLREVLLFLQEFVADVSRPIAPEVASVEYRPTQILTAFMRQQVSGLDGLLYRSSLTGEVCCTLFVENDACLEYGTTTTGSLGLVLQYEGSRVQGPSATTPES